MNEHSQRMPQSLDEFVRLADGTQYQELFRDEAMMEQRLLEAMRESDDGITREIGSGIADGTMTWHTVAITSAYRDFLDSGVAALQELDLAGVTELLAEEQQAAEQARAEGKRRQEEEDGEDLWQGFDWDQK